MPYIQSQRQRQKIDQALADLGSLSVGEFVYTLYRMMKTFCTSPGLIPSGGFITYALCIGAVVCAILEFYRREVADYEDKKIAENGDVT